MNFTERQDKLHCAGKLANVEHMNLMGQRPITTRYTIKNRQRSGVRFIVARSNDWNQVQRNPGLGCTSERTDPTPCARTCDGPAPAFSGRTLTGKFLRFLGILALFLCIVPQVQAQPPWYADWRTYLILGEAAGSSLFATHELEACRKRNDFIHCPDGGYGPFKQREYGIRLPTSIGTAALSIYARAHWQGHWYTELLNDAPVILFSGYNFEVGLKNRSVPTFPGKDAFEKTLNFRVKR